MEVDFAGSVWIEMGGSRYLLDEGIVMGWRMDGKIKREGIELGEGRERE